MKTWNEYKEDYTLTGDLRNAPKAHFEKWMQTANIISAFLKDIDTGGKYERMRHFIPEPNIREMKEYMHTCLDLVQKAGAVENAPRNSFDQPKIARPIR